MYTGKSVKPDIESCKTDFCSIRSDFPDINALDKNRPQYKCTKKPDPCKQVFFLFFFHSLLSFPAAPAATAKVAKKHEKEKNRSVTSATRSVSDINQQSIYTFSSQSHFPSMLFTQLRYIVFLSGKRAFPKRHSPASFCISLHHISWNCLPEDLPDHVPH